MKKTNKIAAALLLALAAPATSMAQNSLRSAYFTEGYTYRHHLNPAFAGERNYVSMPLIGLGNFNIGLQSTVGVSDFIHKLPDGSLTTFLNEAVDANEFLDGLKKRNRMNLDFDMTLLSFGFHKWGGFNTFDLSIKSGTRMNLPKDLFAFAKMGQSGATTYNLKDMGIFTNNYAEIALGHSRKILDNLTVGAKVKFLLGIYSADFHVNDMQLTLSDEKWAVSGQGEFSSAGIVDIPTKLKEKTDNGQTVQEEELDFDNIEMGDPIGGFGMAFDLGATYKVREDLELSLALLDLGWISYKNATKATMAAEPWSFEGFTNVPFDSDNPGNNISIEDQIDNLEDELEDLFQMKAQGKDKHTKALGATLNIGALYTFPYYDKLKFGFLESTRINGRYSWSEGRFSANVAPAKCFDASISYAVSSFGHSFGWILNYHGRGFGLFLGSNHQFFKVTPQFVPVNNANANFSIGINFPFGDIKTL